MSIPKEPRQIMINLMYLVLTAMLALNVSSEILHAFKTINKSVLASNKIMEEKNGRIYQSFQTQLDQQATHDNIKPYYDKAQNVKKRAEEMMVYLEDWKNKVIDRSGGYMVENGVKEIKAESDIDASTKLMVESKGGDELKQKMIDIREFLLKQVSPKDAKTFADQLPLNIVEAEKTENNPSGDWKVGYFQSMPVMAAVTLLSKFQNDIRNSEAMVLNQLNLEAGDQVLKFDDIRAIAITPNSYALKGQKIEAQILMAAYNKSVKPTVTSNGGRVTKVEDGVAYWETEANGVGLQTVKGSVTVDFGFKKETRPYEFTYMVGSEGGSIQLDKMNVFYIGVDNPVTVSAAGYSLEDVSLSFPDGDVKAGEAKGKFLIRATKPSSATGVEVAIMAKTGTGTKKVGFLNVRVKYIPDPVPEVAQKSGGYVPAAVFRPQLGVNAALKNFEFDTRYIVTEFNYSVIKKRSPDLIGPFKVIGPSFNANRDVMKIQQDLKPGDRVFIDDIKARGPDGRTRNLNPLSFTLT